MNNQNNIVLGTGPLGLWVAQFLVEQNKNVILVNRSGRLSIQSHIITTEIKAVDISDAKQVGAVCHGMDCVFHCAMPAYTQWPEKFPPLTNGIIEGLKNTGAKLIYGDNLYAYGDNNGKPLTEKHPHNASGHKGMTRSLAEKELLNNGEFDVVVGKASDFYGPLVKNSLLGFEFFNAAILGKTVKLLGNIELPHTYTYIKDFARTLIKLSDEPDAYGKVWHIPNAPTITTSELIGVIEKEIGKSIKTQSAGKKMVSFLGIFNPMLKELKETMYQWEKPFISDHTKFQKHFDCQFTSHEAAIRETTRWYREG